MNNLIIVLLSACAGLFTQISLAPAHLYIISFIALIPFFIALEAAKTLKSKLLVGTLTGFFANLTGFYWMILVFKNFFFYPLEQSIALFFLYAFVGHLQFFFFSLFYYFLRKGKENSKFSLSNVLLITLGYTFIDYYTPKLFGDTLGDAFDNQVYLRQLVKVIGLPFLTFICAFANASFFADLKARKLKHSYLYIVFILVCFFIGKNENDKQVQIINQSSEYIQVAAIQPNTSGPDKILAETHPSVRTQNLNELLNDSEDAIKNNPNLDLIIWPETSYPAYYTNVSEYENLMKKKLHEFVLKTHVAILFGLTDRDVDNKLYNSAILIQDDGGKIKSEVYHKVILAFMGEYNPFSKNTPSVLQHGEHPSLLHLKTKAGKEVKIAPIICYEAMSPLYVSEAKRLNPDLIIHISNEAWFGYYGLPYSFFYLASFRSIESEIPMIKDSNSGFSGLILPDGSVKFLGNLNDKEILIMTVPIIRK